MRVEYTKKRSNTLQKNPQSLNITLPPATSSYPSHTTNPIRQLHNGITGA